MPVTAAPAAGQPAAPPDAYGRLPLAFEENRGQADPSARFLTRGPGYVALVTQDGLVLALRRPGNVVRMRLVGAREALVEALEPLPGRVNYFIGKDPKKWHTDIPTYARVQARGVYEGIDVVYYGNPRQLEYDFVVAPGADPGVIRLAFDGAERIATDTRGDLVLAVGTGELRLHRPRVYQTIAGRRQEIESAYRVTTRGGRPEIGIALAAWDRGRPLVIDPVLVYSTLLGGSDSDAAAAVAADAAGNAYVTGFTLSVDFPIANALQPTAPVAGFFITHAFVTKLNATGTAVVYSTFLGGSASDVGTGIAVDSTGAAYVAGTTGSADFPTTPSAFQPFYASGGSPFGSDAFAAKLSPSGSALVYATYLGGSGGDQATGVAVTAAGHAVVVGITRSLDFPVANALQSNIGGDGVGFGQDAFVVKLLPDGSDVVYATYLGGFSDDLPYAVAVDAAGNAYVGGVTSSLDFPVTPGAFQTSRPGVESGFLAKLDPAGASLVYSTFLGGSNGGIDAVNGLTVDAAGNVYAVGGARSTDFPVVGGFKATLSPGDSGDGFVAKLNPAGSALLYSTYLGGSGNDFARSVALGPGGGIWVAGDTNSGDFPVTLGANNSTNAAFVARLTPAAGITFAEYLAPSAFGPFASAVALTTDAAGNVYVVGVTQGGALPVTMGALETLSPGSQDGFALRLRALPDLTASASVTAGTVLTPGRTLPVTVRTANTGDAAAGPSTTRLYLRQATTGTRTLRGQTAIASLAAGANISATLTVTIPKTQPAGSYVFEACADDLRQVTEESDANNCGTTSVTLRVPRPDLVVTSVALPAGNVSVVRSGHLSVTARLANQGDLASPATQARIYLARGATRSPTDTPLAALVTFGALMPGQNVSAITSIAIPAAQRLDAYFVIVCSDDRGGVLESAEFNNCAASPGTFTVTSPILAPIRVRR